MHSIQMKRCFSLFLVPAIVFYLLLYNYFISSSIDRMYSNIFKFKPANSRKRAPKNASYKYILYWDKVYGRVDFYLGLGNKIFRGCEVNNCFATDDRSYLAVDQFHAILFHGKEYPSDTYDKPANRCLSQVYIYVNRESPVSTPEWVGSDNFFNWTMTYRLDSDIIYNYGFYENVTTNYKMPTVEQIQQRPRKVAWMVSNCASQNGREDIYERINQYIHVDIYGRCGSLTCPQENFSACHDLLAKNYKFYLSLENSNCKDYVTEKMYAALERDIVPVVYGGADYRKLTPPNSVINVGEFNSVELVAEYLKFLDENPEMYLSLFEWKKHYVIREGPRQNALCVLCKKLNEPLVHKSYDIQKWWSEEKCK